MSLSFSLILFIKWLELSIFVLSYFFTDIHEAFSLLLSNILALFIILPLKGVLKEKIAGNSFCFKHLNKYFTFSIFIISVFFLILIALFKYYLGDDIYLYLVLLSSTCLDSIVNTINIFHIIIKYFQEYLNLNYTDHLLHAGNKENTSNTNINVFYSSGSRNINTSDSINASGSRSINASGTTSNASNATGSRSINASGVVLSRNTGNTMRVENIMNNPAQPGNAQPGNLLPGNALPGNAQRGNVMKIPNILNNPSQTQPQLPETSTTEPNNNVAPNTADLPGYWDIHNKIGFNFSINNGVISIAGIPDDMSELYDEEGKIKHNIENKNIIEGFTNALEYHANFFGNKTRLHLPNFDEKSQKWFDIYKREVYLHRHSGRFFNSKTFRLDTVKFSNRISESLSNNR